MQHYRFYHGFAITPLYFTYLPARRRFYRDDEIAEFRDGRRRLRLMQRCANKISFLCYFNLRQQIFMSLPSPDATFHHMQASGDEDDYFSLRGHDNYSIHT